jgi:hypothetical protein
MAMIGRINFFILSLIINFFAKVIGFFDIDKFLKDKKAILLKGRK